MEQILFDTFVTTLEPVITESESKLKKWRGKFAKAGEATKNGRIYSRKLWESVLGSDRVQNRLSGGMIGVVNHPADGETDLFRSAISTFKLDIDADDYIVGEAVILPTPGGQILEGLLSSGAKVGVSSRGKGTVDENGNVNEDYVLVAFDVVDNPAVPDAIPAVSESTDGKKNNNNAHRRNNMSGGAYEELFRIERGVDETLFMIERGDFSKETVGPLKTILEGTLKELGGLVSEEDKNSLVTPLVDDLQKRIVEARNILRRGKTDKPKDTYKTDGDHVSEDDKIAKVNLDSLKTTGDQQVEGGTDGKPGGNDTADADGTTTDADGKKLSEMEHSSLVAYCEELEKTNESLEKKYQDAVWAIEEFKNRNARSDVDEAVEKAVEDNQVLKEYKDLLDEASSVEEVNKLVERFLKLANSGNNKPKNKPDNTREPLPGSKTHVSESIVVENVDEGNTEGDKKIVNYADFFVALDENINKDGK